MKLRVEIVGGQMMQNAYFITEEETSATIIIDPGAEPERLINTIEKNNLDLKYIVLTHGHFDHIGACEELNKKYNAPIVIAEGEELLIEEPKNNLSTMIGESISIKADIVVKDGDTFKFGDNLEFKAIATPGHTPGGMCLYFEKEEVLISGDTLFKASVGRTDFPYGDSKVLMQSLEKLKALPDTTVVYCGHGDKTTIGSEKVNNPYMGNIFGF